MYHHGWFLIAFERELDQALTPSRIGARRLAIARTEQGIRTFSADCPHRGAHLAMGGKLDGSAIVCPFHGYRIGLGIKAQHDFQVPEYPTLSVGGLVLVRLSDAQENGLTAFLETLAKDHTFVPGFTLSIKAPAALVTENGFDNRHFPYVHGVRNDPTFEVSRGPHGQLMVQSHFVVPTSVQQKSHAKERVVEAPYTAHTFSPGLIAVQLGGDNPYWVITGATPTSEDECIVRLSLALSHRAYGVNPRPELCQYLLNYSRAGLEDDRLMWENLSFTSPHHYTAQDAAVLQFQRFCQEFC